MSDQSMSGLEQKAEDIRSQVVDTAESLREKMTGGHLVDDLMSSETVSAATGALSSLGRQIRSNPVPFALIGVGLAWAMFGPAPRWSSFGSSRSRNGDYRGRPTAGNDQSSGGLTATAGRWASGVGQAAASASDRVGKAVEDLPGAGQAQRSVRAIADTVSDQDPLLLAALGLAFGTALGAMLPGTRLEDETFGGVGKSLRQAGEAQLEAGLEKVKEVAGSAVDAAEQKAEESGLLPTGDGPTVAERLTNVADTAMEAARDTLRGSGSEPS